MRNVKLPKLRLSGTPFLTTKMLRFKVLYCFEWKSDDTTHFLICFKIKLRIKLVKRNYFRAEFFFFFTALVTETFQA